MDQIHILSSILQTNKKNKHKLFGGVKAVELHDTYNTKVTRVKERIHEVQDQKDEFIKPIIKVFISYFKNLNLESQFDIYEKYTSENFKNIDVSLPLDDSTSQRQSNQQ